MSEEVRSKMSQEYDQALEKNRVEPDTMDAIHTGRQQQDVLPSANEGAPVGFVPTNRSAPASAFAAHDDVPLSLGEDLRDHDFPLPSDSEDVRNGAPVTILPSVVVGPATLPDPDRAKGGEIGTMPGDHIANGEIGDMLDQRESTPDLIEQQR